MAIKRWWIIFLAIMNYLAVSPVSMLENVTEFAKVTEREIASSVDKNISGGK